VTGADWIFWGVTEPTDDHAEEVLVLVHLAHVLERFPPVAPLAHLPA
jgi:hypothetical protein